MKTLYLHAKSNLGALDFDTSMLPAKVGIVTTIQHLHEMKKVVDYLWKKEIKAVVSGQVLGCDAGAALKNKDDVDAFLYIGSGEFHPICVALQTGKGVFVLHPSDMKISKVDSARVEKIQKKKKGMLLKFHSASVVGIISTTKNGQSRVQGGVDAVASMESKYPDKSFYHFLCETLNFSELENFPFVECWVNTMCPRVMEDVNVLNIEDLLA
ncbi:diphthamide synthesis protein [Nanoarchaeota archaeon]